MVDYSYTTVPKKLQDFMKKMQEIGVPEILDKNFLASSGFSASNDPSIIPVLKFIGFIDDNGKPTDRWREYRDKTRAGKILAKAISDSYGELFNLYPDAHNRSVAELKSFFTSKTNAGSRAVDQTVNTFKYLCEIANFSEIKSEIKKPAGEFPSTKPEIPFDSIKKEFRGLATGITININIQLTLPETTDESVYDKFFAALKKHLITQVGHND